MSNIELKFKNKIALIRPSIELKQEALSFREELFLNGEKVINGSER